MLGLGLGGWCLLARFCRADLVDVLGLSRVVGLVWVDGIWWFGLVAVYCWFESFVLFMMVFAGLVCG